MRDDKQDHFVGELLEATLKRLGGEEPRAGLELRVLAGVRSRQGAARRRRMVWTLAACAGMVAAIVLVLHSTHAPGRHRVASASLPQQTPKPLASSGSADSRFWSPRLAQAPRQKPRTPKPGIRATKRPEQFPTPMPLTEQEKLLMAYFDKATKPDAVVGATATNEAPVTDLRIPGIEITPMEIKPLDDAQSETEK